MYSELDKSQVASLRKLVTDCDVLITGLMGAGKTTLIRHMQRYVPLRYLAQGEITRSILEFAPAPLVVQADARPEPWGFELVLEILAPLLAIPDPYVLDGLPKHPHEASWLVDQLKQRGRAVIVIAISADVHTVKRRLSSPSRVHRTDSWEEIDHRISTFREHFAQNMQILAPVVTKVIELDSVTYRPIELLRQLADELSTEDTR